MRTISVGATRCGPERGSYHDGEDTLLHLTGVLSTEDDHLHPLEVDLDRGSGRHALREAVRRELAGVVDDEVGLAEVLQFFFRRADEHVVLERMVSDNFTTEIRKRRK